MTVASVSSELAPLTDRQREIYEYIRKRVTEDHRPPTVREIGEQFGISSTNGVRSVLSALIRKGYVSRSPKVSRGLEVAEAAVPKAEPLREGEGEGVEIPIVGRVAAGTPILAVQNLEGTVVVDRNFLAARRDVFALRVKGDSMIEAGILDGDLIFARQQQTAEPGQMIVAQVEDEATVKYFHPEKNGVRLEPANSAYKPIWVPEDKNFSIAGLVIGVLRKVN